MRDIRPLRLLVLLSVAKCRATPPAECVDRHEHCHFWAQVGECDCEQQQARSGGDWRSYVWRLVKPGELCACLCLLS
jgi:hypothetical protein